MDKGDRVDLYKKETDITQDGVAGDNLFTECLNQPSIFIKGQYFITRNASVHCVIKSKL